MSCITILCYVHGIPILFPLLFIPHSRIFYMSHVHVGEGVVVLPGGYAKVAGGLEHWRRHA